MRQTVNGRNNAETSTLRGRNTAATVFDRAVYAKLINLTRYSGRLRKNNFRQCLTPFRPDRKSEYYRADSYAAGLVDMSDKIETIVGPRVIVTSGFGLSSLIACLLRLASRKATHLIYVAEPLHSLRAAERVVLRLSDGVLVDSHGAERALLSVTDAVYRITLDYELPSFLRLSLDRSLEEARRIIVAGDLNPGSGASDLLAASIKWANANADQAIELHWIGTGDLSDLLAAQPLPVNLFQTFHGSLDERATAAVFAQGGMLAVPAIVNDGRGHVAEALAAGLPVIGSLRSRAIRHHVTDGVNGWLFDPLRSGDLLAALSRAMGTSGPCLVEMRRTARFSVSAPLPGNNLSRVERHDRRVLHSAHSAAQVAL